MKIRVVTVALLILVAATAIPSMAAGEKIEIDDDENKVMFQKFKEGDIWSIILWNASTNALAYQFNGTIGEQNTTLDGKTWKVWFNCVSPGALKHGILYSIKPGTYNVSASGVTGGNLISADPGIITILKSDGDEYSPCGGPIPPVPELSTVVLVSSGLLGILFISRRYKN
ncbi:hypothetical protein ANME2D_00952 [Candidatus Methanoperedens nitroreducens]|uniref:Uncharacterized protein n=1 Tax=Candidatus Methanoperedens nitratireducens TaxID=1392998 RepID=A0A062V9X9_9EURY|nr:hypothetical protein [Candidatus Methanoperedens nitroreducens]KCZ72524.1 hypothetical protein ANME2D_00952 [Candidatus Methanoperedens nitroreducens]MDJ1423542.1 hypothetical protein [Candidatus Methanoperedens sp.]